MKKIKIYTINITPVLYTVDLGHKLEKNRLSCGSFRGSSLWSRRQPRTPAGPSSLPSARVRKLGRSPEKNKRVSKKLFFFSVTVGIKKRVRSFVHTRDGVPKLGVSVGRQRIHLHQYLSGGGGEGGQVRINAKVTGHPKTSTVAATRQLSCNNDDNTNNSSSNILEQCQPAKTWATFA